MSEKFTLPVEKGLCKDCKWRFERIFIPTRPEEFEDENGNNLFESYDGKSDTLVVNICLLSELELDTDITIECSHYKKMEGAEKEIISLFKHEIK